jgi:glycine cleavage system aminomethyltransferase T
MTAPSPGEIPARSEIVIIGGGVIGCSIAYHLAGYPEHGFAASVRSAGYGYTTERSIFSAYLPAAVADATAQAAGQPGFVVEVAADRYPATRLTAPLYDPAGSRIRA